MAVLNPYQTMPLSGGITSLPGYKTDILNQYRNIATQSEGDFNRENLTYEDSPIFNQGYELWDPSSIGSQLIQNVSIPYSGLTKGDEGLLGAASIHSMPLGIEQLAFGDKTSAGFKRSLLEPIISGKATAKEKSEFANVFGHEMTHLGWPYKPTNELIDVPGVGKEKGFAGSLKAGMGGYGAGEEQWNYLHDLMYGGASTRYGDVERNKAIEELQQSFLTLPKGSPQKEKAYEEAQKTLEENPEKFTTSKTVDYLTDEGLINPGDLSYTPKAFNELAWSGLTTEGKQAIGFGVNPFEDTRAAGQWHRMQQEKRKEKGIKQVEMQKQIQAAEAVNQGRQNIGGGWTQTNTGGGGATFSGPGGQTHQGWSNTPAGYAAAAASEGSFAQGGRIGRKEIIARGGILGAF